jgi:hypothetical protein
MRHIIYSTCTTRFGAFLAAAAAVFAIGASSATSASAAEGCPNEAARVQQGVTALLPECRGWELVTPVDKNDEEATVPDDTTALEVPYQAADQGPATTFAMTGAIPGSQSAGQFIDGISTGTPEPQSLWTDLSLAPETRFEPIGEPGPRPAGQWEYYSPNLTCGIEKTALPLASHAGEEKPDIAPGETASEEIERLYMWTPQAGAAPSESARGTYTLVTNEKPREDVSPYSGGGYIVDGASRNCEHIAFDAEDEGSELPVAPGSPDFAPRGAIYEWTAADGVHIASVLPDGKPATEVVASKGGNQNSNIGAMSEDGSRLFFTALSDEQEKPIPLNLPRSPLQIFMRVQGTKTVEISKTDTAVVDDGARFQAASSDGSRVFFTANYGLAASTSKGPATWCQFTPGSSESAGQGCDLYEYNGASAKLTDLSADTVDATGANVRGVLGISRDGTYVYFSATGQLVAGVGNTGAVNEANHEANVYAYHEGHLSYVATINETEAGGGTTANDNKEETIDAVEPGNDSGLSFLVARVTPNGKTLLLGTKDSNINKSFNNVDQVTGKTDPELYEYQYTESPGAPTLPCVSCSPVGHQPISSTRAYLQPFSPLGPFVQVRSGSIPRNVLEDGRVFFDSYSPLVPQEEGKTGRAITIHAYEWRPDTVGGCTLAAGCITLLDNGTGEFPSYFEGASEDGENVYFTTPQSLAPQDEDGGLRDVYDVRVDGGIYKAPEAERCSSEKDTCQGPGETFNESPIGSTGAGNQPPLTLVNPAPAPKTPTPVKITGHSSAKTTLTLVLSLPSAGSISVSGSGVVGAHHSEARPGVYKLTLSLTAKTKAALKAHRRVKVSVRVSFMSSSGVGSSTALTATLK